MILVIIRMEVCSEKRLELSQTIQSLLRSIRVQSGCRRCEFCQSIDDENRLYLLEEWDTEENWVGHLQSPHFGILRGAMNLLRKPHERSFHTLISPQADERHQQAADR